MPRRLARFLAQKVIQPVLMAYLDIYATDEDDDPGSGTPLRMDPHSTVTGNFEVAANRDHFTDEIILHRPGFGFGPPRRANETVS